MIKRGFSGATILIAAGCFLPAAGSASTLFTLSEGGPASGSYSSGVVTVNYNTLSINGAATNGTFTETYTNSTGVLTVTGQDSSASLPSAVTLFQIHESLNLASAGATFSLYSGATSITNWNTQFLTDLGLQTSPAPTLASLTAESFGVTTGSTGNVSSATLSMTFETPEPSTFALLGVTLGALCIPLRRQLKLTRY